MSPLLDVVGPRFRWALEAIDVMNAELEAAGVEGDRGLPLTCLEPPDPMIGLAMDVYAHHVRELIGRYVRTRKLADLDAMTDAEVMVGLYKASLACPLQEGPSALYARIFRSVFGAVPWDGPEWREAWPGQLDEFLHGARKAIRRRRPGE